MTRFWASWWADLDDAEPDPPFDFWSTGFRSVAPRESVCAVIDAPGEEQLWILVDQHFPDNERRFISAKPDQWQPASDRFPQ